MSPTLSAKPWPEFLKGVGTMLVMKVGGASGPLYGTLFMALGKELPAEPTRADLVRAFRGAITAVQARGKSERGQKTMLDVLIPVAETAGSGRGGDRARSRVAAHAARRGDHSDEGGARPRLVPGRPLDRPYGSRRAVVRADDRSRRKSAGEGVMESVGVVIVSHSPKVAEGAADMVRQMVGEEVPLAWTGGNPSGGLGTDVGQIMAAIDRAWSNAGVVILVDLGGAETNSEMAIEMLPERPARQGADLQCAGGRGRGGGGDRSGRRVERRYGAADGRGIFGAMKNGTATDQAATGAIVIAHEVGLHARPSVKLTKLAKTFASKIELGLVRRRSVDRCQEHREGHGVQGGERLDAAFPRRSAATRPQAVTALVDLVRRDFDEGHGGG